MSSVENSKHWLDQAEDHAEQALSEAERTSPERTSPERNSPGRAGRVRRGRASAGLTRSRLLGIGLILISALLLLSCGDAGDEVAGIKKTTSTTTSVPADNTSGSAASVKVANTNLGDVLVTSKGMTLYMFQPDGTDGSTCVDACAQTWPPLTTVGQPTGTDISPDLLGTIERPDGSLQVTANGHPLYQYSGDSQAGDTNGQGIDGTWFALSSAGKAVQESPSGTSYSQPN